MPDQTSIVCLGNELAGDDGIGYRVGRVLKALPLPAGLEPVDLLGWTGQRIEGGWSVYLGDVPRTLSYITDLAAGYPELEQLVELIEKRVLPGMSA